MQGAVDSLTPDCVCVCVLRGWGGLGRCVRAGPEGSASPWFLGASRVTAGAWGLLGYGGLRGALNHYSSGPRFGNECSGRNQLLQQDKSELRTRKMHPVGASTRPQRNARDPQEGKETMTLHASSHLAPTGRKHVQTPATGPNRVRADDLREPGCTRVVTLIRNARPSTSPSSVPQKTSQGPCRGRGMSCVTAHILRAAPPRCALLPGRRRRS